jgi:hypothetical protein
LLKGLPTVQRFWLQRAEEQKPAVTLPPNESAVLTEIFSARITEFYTTVSPQKISVSS